MRRSPSSADLVAMCDVLEPDLGFLGRLQTRTWPSPSRWREFGATATPSFRKWRMRLSNEHLHHFDRDSLVALLAHHGSNA
ncbi:hypothetical protein [Mesorhizobium sp. WSM4935]|uniref:hypothetical protein n=1 Tax=Mesorhizobium sp. WSM4935 TaxID=3038547 RepID=UPI002415101E|nr:hypothetical protein [Mesorhizobium sp. WSM4935]